MGDFDWKNLQVYHWLLIGAGVVVLLALVLFLFTKASRLRIPLIIACSLCSLLAGLAAGVILLASVGYHWESEQQSIAGTARIDVGVAPEGGRQGGGRQGGGGQGGGGQGGGRRGGGGGGGAPGGRGGRGGSTPKMQLAALVVKIDQLTEKPLTIPLDDAKREKLRKELAGLEQLKDLSDEEALKRLEALNIILEKDKPVLEAAGFPAPAGGNQPLANTANPFLEGEQARRLKALQGRLDGPKTE